MFYKNEFLKFSELSDEEVQEILAKNKISLSVHEARDIEEKILKRPPTLTEAIAFGIQGSEHCSYRSSRKYLEQLPTDAPNVILGPKEDAGIVEIARDGDDRYGVVFAHESHNHPSQIVPYEGAATGVGGIVRDVLCMGAKVIGIADPLRFGEIENNKSRWIADGVVSGVSGYGNPIGVPNLTGDIYFDPSFNDNCLVNVVALGLIKESEIIHSFAPKDSLGYNMILVGKPTDNSGFGGASFASIELDEGEKEKNKGAVQEPNAFLKRHLFESTYDLFRIIKEKNLFDKVGFKDLGAGGVLCGTVEMAEAGGYGAEIDMEKIHVSMDDLHPSVVLCAETQERFLWIADNETTELILNHYNKKWDFPKVSVGAKASVVGKIVDGNYVVNYNGEKIVDVEPKIICEGLKYDLEVESRKSKVESVEISEPKDFNKIIKQILAHENIACTVPVFEQYDKQVQGNTVIERGQADAGVVAPLKDMPDKIKNVGVALSVSGNPRHGLIDSYWQGVNAVVESMRKVSAVGAYPIALTDCLNYGNPEKPEQMNDLVEGIKGVADATKNIHLKTHKDSPTPIVSGNVSLYNNSEKGGSIAPSAIIACLGKIDDYKKAITRRFKKSDSAIYLIGKRKDELGGSIYYSLFNKLGLDLPKPDFDMVEQEIYSVTDVVNKELVLSCHNIADGGLVVALAEMCFDIPTVGQDYDKVGINVDCTNIANSNSSALFSETGGFVLEVEDIKITEFEEVIKNYNKVELFKIGKTTAEKQFVINNDNENVIDLKVEEIEKIWLEGLRDKL